MNQTATKPTREEMKTLAAELNLPAHRTPQQIGALVTTAIKAADPTGWLRNWAIERKYYTPPAETPTDQDADGELSDQEKLRQQTQTNDLNNPAATVPNVIDGNQVSAATAIASIVVPLQTGPLGDGYTSRHIDLQLNRPQAEGLKRLIQGLDQQGARLKNDRRVVTKADAVRWLLEQLLEEKEEGTMN